MELGWNSRVWFSSLPSHLQDQAAVDSSAAPECNAHVAQGRLYVWHRHQRGLRLPHASEPWLFGAHGRPCGLPARLDSSLGDSAQHSCTNTENATLMARSPSSSPHRPSTCRAPRSFPMATPGRLAAVRGHQRLRRCGSGPGSTPQIPAAAARPPGRHRRPSARWHLEGRAPGFS